MKALWFRMAYLSLYPPQLDCCGIIASSGFFSHSGLNAVSWWMSLLSNMYLL